MTIFDFILVALYVKWKSFLENNVVWIMLANREHRLMVGIRASKEKLEEEDLFSFYLN